METKMAAPQDSTANLTSSKKICLFGADFFSKIVPNSSVSPRRVNTLLCGEVSPHAGSSAQPFLMASPAALTPQLFDVTLGSALSVPVHHAFIN